MLWVREWEPHWGRDDMNLAAQILKHPWTAAKGAAKYAAAIAAGDLADDETTARRRAICRECPSRVRLTVKGATSESDWCGPPFESRLDAALPTCGCLIAAKTAVASEPCPQGRW